MKKSSIIILAALMLLGVGGMSYTDLNQKDERTVSFSTNGTASESFETMMKVLTHKRCINCHPAGDRPRQGEDSHIHNFDVQRGEDGHGVVALQCKTCHQSSNNSLSGVPGAPHWHLAPRSMAWEGLDKYEIAQAMLDKNKNGNRSVEEIEKHLTEDQLVLWVFEPGVNNEGIPREKPPVSKEDYIKAVKDWIAEGAIIPSK
ncbi:MAG: hypothetical protein MRZ79_13980 [Bacteroidia bacterium]|nr:hypothetical protein [Bacteroidia bacterium]